MCVGEEMIRSKNPQEGFDVTHRKMEVHPVNGRKGILVVESWEYRGLLSRLCFFIKPKIITDFILFGGRCDLGHANGGNQG